MLPLAMSDHCATDVSFEASVQECEDLLARLLDGSTMQVDGRVNIVSTLFQIAKHPMLDTVALIREQIPGLDQCDKILPCQVIAAFFLPVLGGAAALDQRGTISGHLLFPDDGLLLERLHLTNKLVE